MITDLLQAVNLICYLTLIILLVMGIHQQNTIRDLHRKLYASVKEENAFILILMEILSQGISSPHHRLLYQKLLKRGSKGVPKDRKETFEMFQEVVTESYSKASATIKTTMEQLEDPDSKEKLREIQEQLDGAVSLMGTVDENSSDDQLARVRGDINGTIARINSIIYQ